jgi:hypothetical protein
MARPISPSAALRRRSLRLGDALRGEAGRYLDVVAGGGIERRLQVAGLVHDRALIEFPGPFALSLEHKLARIVDLALELVPTMGIVTVQGPS